MIAFMAFPSLAKSALTSGSPSPTFSLKDLDGKTTALEDYLREKVLILSFFASWSKSCQEEMLFLKELDAKDKNNRVNIIAVSFDRKLEKLSSFINENNIGFKVLHDKKLRTLKDFRILIIPTLFVIDREGNIHSVYVDFDRNVEKAVANDIQKLLTPSKK